MRNEISRLSPCLIEVPFLFLIAVCCTGCGDSGPPRFSLSGQVTYDGQPVTNGSIAFEPTDASLGKSASADLIDGRYDIPRNLGPIVGTYTVWIEAERPSGKKIRSEDGSGTIDQLAQYIPAAYNEDTTLQVEITDDRDDLDFSLEKVATTPASR